MKTYIILLVTGQRICFPHCQCNCAADAVTFTRTAATGGSEIIAQFFTAQVCGYYEI